MSVYNKPELKCKSGTNTPSLVHKKNNSLNFSNTGRFMQDSTKYQKNHKLEIKSNINNNTENNIINHNNFMVSNSNININKLLTTTNKNNKYKEINLNKNCSPTSKMNKPGGNNSIKLRNKQSTSQNTPTTA